MTSTAKYARIDNNLSWVYSLFVTEGRWKIALLAVVLKQENTDEFK
jgi:hypothetical protein